MTKLRYLICCSVLFLSACSTHRTLTPLPDERDPLEKLNRGIFAVNQVFDKTMAVPAAKTYQATVPPVLRDRVRDLLQHLREPNNFANALLQARLADAGKVAARFVFNTVFGVFGLIDMADCALDLKYTNHDFGQTLGSWGVKHGPYVTIPLRGPSTFRDVVGRAVDFVMDPFNIIMWERDKVGPIYIREVTEGIDDRYRIMDTLDELKRTSVDYYAGMRTSYYQWRMGNTANKYESLDLDKAE